MLTLAANALYAPTTAAAEAPPTSWQIRSWAPLEAAVRAQIAAGQFPGAVVVIGDRDAVRYVGAFGERALEPKRVAMTADTVFDLASLTKVIATTTAILRLNERGKLPLDAPVARYWPAFSRHGKADVTVRQLLAHTSGLPADLDLTKHWSGYGVALRQIEAQRLVAAPGAAVLYSDINFAALGELVQRASHMSLARYCQRFIFTPLHMHSAGFRPGHKTLRRVAPTTADERGRFGNGHVHDPTARRMGGVAGHAGLFGSADDLARFAQMLLRGGELDGKRILQRATVATLGEPQSTITPPGTHWRGLGWALDAPLVARRDQLPPVGLIGHTGYTGTGLWIDLVTQRFVIVLTNRVHPFGGGDVRSLRDQVLALVANTHAPIDATQLATQLGVPWPSTAAVGANGNALAHSNAQRHAQPNEHVETGIDVLRGQSFAPLAGLRLGLVTNLTGVDARGERTIDLLRWAPGNVQLAAIFTPEHGLGGDVEGPLASGVEPLSGIALYSLYGTTRRPTAAMLKDIDALVFDVQDVGARHFTYIATLGYVLEAAAAAKLPVWVLDRPNPIGADVVDGPMLDEDQNSFTAYLPMPVQYGMTIGEVARMIVTEKQLDVVLHVMPMNRYRRDMRYTQTGLAWIPPSPNLHTPTQALLYPGVALVEGANISVGRGTDHPFEWVGAPWINAAELAAALTPRATPAPARSSSHVSAASQVSVSGNLFGVRVRAITFTPRTGPYQAQICHGIELSIADPQTLRATRFGIALISVLQRLYATHFEFDKTRTMIGSRVVEQALRDGADPAQIAEDWQHQIAAFQMRRARFLLYE